MPRLRKFAPCTRCLVAPVRTDQKSTICLACFHASIVESNRAENRATCKPGPYEGTALIPMWGRNGGIAAWALVDEGDADYLCDWRWTSAARYAVDSTSTPTVRMHRLLMGLQPGDRRHVDHINRDRSDNRRSNLRVVSQAENAQNQSLRCGTSSQFRGVGWHAKKRKWQAYARVNGQQKYLGLFERELDAARAAAAFRATHMPFAEADPRLEEVA